MSTTQPCKHSLNINNEPNPAKVICDSRHLPLDKLHSRDCYTNLEISDAMVYIRSLFPLVTKEKRVRSQRLANGWLVYPTIVKCLHQDSTDQCLIITDYYQRYLTLKQGSMWEPISPQCLDTKITNDSVHFILLVCLALLLDTHWLFQCEPASSVLCCCSVWPHRFVRLFWYLLCSLSGAGPHRCV